MKLLFLLGIFTACATYAQQQGTPQARITTQTRSGTANATSAGTATAGTAGVTGTTTTGTTGTTGSTASGTGLTGTTTQSGVFGGTNVTPETPILENTTNLFGQIVGVATNLPAAGVGTAGAGAGTLTGTTVGTAAGGTVAQQIAQGIGAPGFTQVTITLQGTVQSEVDRQSILNRFQGLPGFIVVDQLQVAGQNNGQAVNEAAGAGTSPSTGTGTGINTPQP